jgi:membrane protease YdiL (CAAX protease family)
MREPDARDAARVLAITLVPIAGAMALGLARAPQLGNALLQGSFFLIPLLYARTAGLGAWAGNGFAPLPPRRIAYVLLASLGTFWLLNGLTHLQDLAMRLMGLKEGADAQAKLIKEGIEHARKSGLAPTMAAFVVIPPFCEEIFFRGILFRGLLKRFGPLVALGGTTLLFAAFHPMDVQKFLMIFVGAYFGTLVYLTGSLWAGIIAHAANNFAVITLMWIYEGQLPEFVGPWWMYVLSAIVFALAMTCLFLDRRSSVTRNP